MEHAKPKISEFEMPPGALKEPTDCLSRAVTLSQAQSLGCACKSAAGFPWLQGGMQLFHGKCYFTVSSVHREQGYKE